MMPKDRQHSLHHIDRLMDTINGVLHLSTEIPGSSSASAQATALEIIRTSYGELDLHLAPILADRRQDCRP